MIYEETATQNWPGTRTTGV